jgi:hypothetical protein
VSIEERPNALRAFRDHLPDIQPSRDTPMYVPMNDSDPRLDTACHRILSPCHGTPRASTSVEAIATAAGPGYRVRGRTSSRMTYKSSSAASDVSLAPFGSRIIRAMQPSAARGETAECVALQWRRPGEHANKSRRAERRPRTLGSGRRQSRDRAGPDDRDRGRLS